MSKDIKDLNSELADALVNFHSYHDKMELMKNFYHNSVFYAPKSGKATSSEDVRANLLKVFADKNIHYTSAESVIKVAGSPEDRQNASIREKIIYAVRRKSNSAMLRRRWARDTTILSAAVCETVWDAKNRCASIRRYDPRHCYWQLSNDNDRRVLAFWAVFPITKAECKERYGIEVVGSGGIPMTAFDNNNLRMIDGQDWLMQAIRWDGKTKTAWVGDRFIEETHNHGFDEIPIDICMPFESSNDDSFGDFYIEPLLSLQAELNHVTKQRSNIVDRMSNPVVWGRNIIGRGFDDLKSKMEGSSGGGFVGLGRQGELGLLQVNDVKMLDAHEDRIIQQMMRLSGFGAATFGESVGANTSGDALGMYFTPTQRLIEDQNIAWKAFDESINAKILMAYYNNMKTGEQLTLTGYAPGSTVMSAEDNTMKYEGGAFTVIFTKENIGGDYNNVTIPRNITPKNEIEEKRWALEAVAQGVISRTTAYEMFDFLSPEDELAMLTQEQSEPVLNPEGTQKILANAQQPALPAGNAPAPAA